MVALIDTNVVIGYLIARAEHDAAEKIIDVYCTNGTVSGFVAAHSVPDIFYILRKDFSSAERRQILIDLLDILDVVSVDKAKLLDALKDDGFTDFEDCIQAKCADEIFADYIITRNPKDFSKTAIPVVEPNAFVQIIEASAE